MIKANLSLALASASTLILFTIFTTLFVNSVRSATAEHVVISEVQIGAGDADDEFVELYNPTGSAIDLTGWRLSRKTSTGGSGGNLVAALSGSVPAHGYFLVAPAVDYTGSVTPDQNYSTGSRIASSNTVLLYSDAGVTLVDKLGLGSAVDSETSPFSPNPDPGQSIERKANSSSTVDSMTTGADLLLGNGEDTDNNSLDFIVRGSSDPQNSQSAVEPEVEPSPTPSESPSPSPSESPSPSPSETATPTPTPTETPSPTPSASPSPSPSLTCSIRFITLNFIFQTLRMPLFICGR